MLKLTSRHIFNDAQRRLMALSLICCAVTASCQTSVNPAVALPNSPDGKIQLTVKPMASDCRPFKRQDGFFSVKAAFSDPGKYCLTEDFIQRSRYDSMHGTQHGSPGTNGAISAFGKTHDVDIDLQGHLVTGAPFKNTTGLRASDPSTAIVRFHNGIVKTPGPEGVGVAMAPYKDPHNTELSEEDEPPSRGVFSDKPTGPRVVPLLWNYLPPTNHTAENLKIESGGRGVIMSGTGNVLRNNVIEVESATAAYLYGPGSVIEGNTFIVHQTKGEPAATLAILKLRDAHGAVIRNNRFIVKGVFAGKAEAAINLLESKDVVIEGNTIEGAKTLVRKDATSTTVEKGNEVK
jgi:hypothetical protein